MVFRLLHSENSKQAINKISSMTVERAQVLNYIRFEWKLKDHSFSVEGQRCYEELRIFKSRTGHCIVLWRFIHNKALGGRVATQWKQYKLMSGNKLSSMTVERTQELKDIWFEWKLQAHSVTVEWQSRYSTIILWRRMTVACDCDEWNQCQWRLVAMTVVCDGNKWWGKTKVTNKGDNYWHWHKMTFDSYWWWQKRQWMMLPL